METLDHDSVHARSKVLLSVRYTFPYMCMEDFGMVIWSQGWTFWCKQNPTRTLGLFSSTGAWTLDKVEGIMNSLKQQSLLAQSLHASERKPQIRKSQLEQLNFTWINQWHCKNVSCLNVFHVLNIVCNFSMWKLINLSINWTLLGSKTRQENPTRTSEL